MKKVRRGEELRKREREGKGGEDEEGGTQPKKKSTVEQIEVFNVNEEELEVEEWAFDDVDGRPIDKKLVREARKEEMAFMKKIPVFEEVSLEECWKMTGRPPISTKWVDHDKGRGGVDPGGWPEISKRRATRTEKTCSPACLPWRPRRPYSSWRRGG